ncbi:hypothetical protein Tco_1380314, partial [Tanacetum coccineum]
VVDAQTRFEAASKQSNDPPVSRVNTLGSGEDSMKLIELMAHCTKLCELVNIAGVSKPVSTADMVQDTETSTPSPTATKNKGKAIMTEPEPEQTTTKLKLRQERVGLEAAIRLQEQLNEEECQRIARDAEIAKQLHKEINIAGQEKVVVEAT